MSQTVDSRVVIELSINIDAPCQDVFDLMADLCKASEVADAPKPKMITEQPISVGTRWISNGVGGPMYSTVTIYDRPHRFVRQITGSQTGTVEDIFEPTGSGTKLIRKCDVECGAGRWTYKTDQEHYLEKLKTYLERRVQWEREAHDETIIAATRVRVMQRQVTNSITSHNISPVAEKHSTGVSNRAGNQFGCKGYQRARVINGGPRFLFGSVDTYITCLYGQPTLAFKKGISYFCSEAPRILLGKFSRRTQLIFPRRGYEDLYWEDAVSLFKKPGIEEGGGHEWSKGKCFLIVTNVPPSAFKDNCFPLVSIDITDMTPTEAQLLIISLGHLCSKNRLIPSGKAEGFGRPLFEQNLALLRYTVPQLRANNALDILSLPAMVIPTMTIDFKYFRQEVRDSFNSFCEETLSSREGALPFSEILEMRQELKEEEVTLLAEEKAIRGIWS